MRQLLYYKMRELLQHATILLQNVTELLQNTLVQKMGNFFLSYTNSAIKFTAYK